MKKCVVCFGLGLLTSLVPSGMATANGPYDQLFLEGSELPPGLKAGEDRRSGAGDAADFKGDGATFVGFRVWNDAYKDKAGSVDRLVDARFVFKTENDATAFFSKRSVSLAEGVPVAPKAVTVGDESRAFSGVPAMFAQFGLDRTQVVYLVRQGRVVIKLYCSLGKAKVNGLEVLAPIAVRAATRVKAGGS